MFLFYKTFPFLLLLNTINCLQYFVHQNKKWSDVSNNSLLDKIQSDSCRNQIIAYGNALQRLENWAVEMFDASVKMTNGILRSDKEIHNGAFEQCSNIEHKGEPFGIIKGHYCKLYNFPFLKEHLEQIFVSFYNVKLENPAAKIKHVTNFEDFIITEEAMFMKKTKLYLLTGVCIPLSCAAYQDAFNFVKIFYNSNSLRYIQCDKSTSHFTTIDIFAASIYSLIALLILLSTLYDLGQTLLPKGILLTKPIYLSFSLWKNGKFLLGTNTSQLVNKEVITCIFGLRSLTTVWIILLHKRQNVVTDLNYNIMEQHSILRFIFDVRAYSVDTFFVISGLMVYKTYTLIKTVSISSITRLYIHRYIRLTAPLAALILLMSSLFQYLNSGPMWNYKTPCKKNWWPTLLYVQNYLTPEEICIGQTWYLAVDMQLFVLSPLVILPLRKWPRAGLCWMALLIVVSIAIRFPMNEENRIVAYFSTYARFGPWLIGILLGFFLQHPPKEIHPIVNAVCWITALVTMFYMQFYMTQIHVVTRHIWATCISWMIFSSHIGYGGPFNWFLSLPVWYVLSKLSYCMFLLHTSVQTLIVGSQNQQAHFNLMEGLFILWGDVVFVSAAAVLWTLIFEIPVQNLDKLFGQKIQTSKMLKICETC